MRLYLSGLGTTDVSISDEALSLIGGSPVACVDPSFIGALNVGQAYCDNQSSVSSGTPDCMPLQASGPLAPGQAYCGGGPMPGYTCAQDSVGNCVSVMSKAPAPGAGGMTTPSTSTWMILGGVLLAFMFIGGRK